MKERERGQNDKLDLIRCAAIYGVVFLHIMLPGRLGVAINCLARAGVPLFFLSAGYFSWRRDCAVLRRRALRTARLLLAACLPPAALGMALAVRSGGSAPEYLLGRVSPAAVKEFFLFQLLPLPYSWPLWFLGALLLLYCLWWGVRAALGEEIPYQKLAAPAAVLLAVHLALGEVRFLLGGTVNSLLLRSLWLDGIPFFLLGLWMRENRTRWEGLSRGLILGWVLTGAVLSLGERWLSDFMDLHLGSILMATGLMAAAVREPEVPSALLRKTACFCGKNLTFYIYALHIPLYGVIKEWREEVDLFARLMDAPWLLPFAVAAGSTVLALALHGAAERGREKRRKSHEDH